MKTSVLTSALKAAANSSLNKFPAVLFAWTNDVPFSAAISAVLASIAPVSAVAEDTTLSFLAPVVIVSFAICSVALAAAGIQK